jgi:hypothetical protein
LDIVPEQSLIQICLSAADSSDAAIGSAVPSEKMEEAMVVMEEEATKPQEGEMHSLILVVEIIMNYGIMQCIYLLVVWIYYELWNHPSLLFIMNP